MSQPHRPGRANGLSHLVLNVRDLEASHRFWTEVIGWEMSGEVKKDDIHMRFYRGSAHRHHDIALVQSQDIDAFAPVSRFDMSPKPGAGVNHIAIEYEKDAWEQQVAHVRSIGADIVWEIEHGMSHSLYLSDPDGNGIELLYDLPASTWSHRVDEALNYYRIIEHGIAPAATPSPHVAPQP